MCYSADKIFPKIWSSNFNAKLLNIFFISKIETDILTFVKKKYKLFIFISFCDKWWGGVAKI